MKGKYTQAQTGKPSPKCSVEHKKAPVKKSVPSYRNAKTQ